MDSILNPYISEEEQYLNLYFRGGGGEEMSFEYQQNLIDEWRDRFELDVLIQRVLDEKKPLACYVVQREDNPEETEEVANEIRDYVVDHGLYAQVFLNSYGMWLVNFVKHPNRTLTDLCNVSELREACRALGVRVPSRQLLGQTLGSCCKTPCDHTEGMSILECGIVYGYPLTTSLDIEYRP